MRYLSAIALLSGTIIGAGMFSLPYVFSQAGWASGILYLFVFSVVVALAHLFYADVILRVPSRHRLPGYARQILGPVGYRVALTIVILGTLFALAVYLALSQSFFLLLSEHINTPAAVGAFWLSASLVLSLSAAFIAGAEAAATIGIVVVIGLIFFLGLTPNEGGLANGISRFFALPPIVAAAVALPFGSALFSFAGRTAIPLVVERLRAVGAPPAAFTVILRRVILAGTLLPAFAYALFVLGIFGIADTISPDAVSGIDGARTVARPLIGALGLAAIWSSYVVIGRNIFDSLVLDVRIRRWIATGIVLFAPPVLLLLAAGNFLHLVALAGGVFLALEQIIIVLLWRRTHAAGIFSIRVFRRPVVRETAAVALTCLFLGGLAFQVWFFVTGAGGL